MSVTSQLIEPSVETEVSKVTFCNPQVNHSQSFQFIRKLSLISISNITFMRGVFNENDFIEIDLHEMMVKLINPKPRNTKVMTFIRWLKNACNLLKERRLKKMIFELNDKFGDGTYHELYILNYNYDHDQITLEINEEIKMSSMDFDKPISDEIMDETKKLLHNLQLMTKNLPPLSRDHSIRMILMLNEELDDFSLPNHFSFAEDEDVSIITGGESKTKLGKVITSYHSFGVVYKRYLNDQKKKCVGLFATSTDISDSESRIFNNESRSIFDQDNMGQTKYKGVSNKKSSDDLFATGTDFSDSGTRIIENSSSTVINAIVKDSDSLASTVAVSIDKMDKYSSSRSMSDIIPDSGSPNKPDMANPNRKRTKKTFPLFQRKMRMLRE